MTASALESQFAVLLGPSQSGNFGSRTLSHAPIGTADKMCKANRSDWVPVGCYILPWSVPSERDATMVQVNALDMPFPLENPPTPLYCAPSMHTR